MFFSFLSYSYWFKNHRVSHSLQETCFFKNNQARTQSSCSSVYVLAHEKLNFYVKFFKKFISALEKSCFFRSSVFFHTLSLIWAKSYFLDLPTIVGTWKNEILIMLICILISSKFRSVVSWRITNVSTSSQCITSNLLKFMRRLDFNVSNSTRNQYLWNS